MTAPVSHLTIRWESTSNSVYVQYLRNGVTLWSGWFPSLYIALNQLQGVILQLRERGGETLDLGPEEYQHVAERRPEA